MERVNKGNNKRQQKERKKKKMTKKQVYASYGIEYQDGKISFHGIWVRELLKKGNSKVGKKVYTFSLPAGTKGTCICDCIGCYAKTGRYIFPNVVTSLEMNQFIVETDIDFFYRAISAQLETLKSGEIRIHAAGDFNTKNSEEYAKTWKRIVTENKRFLFWTYTKIQKYENLFDETDNGNIVKSVINGVGFNYGHCDYIINTYKKLKAMGASVYICRCGIDKNQHCQGCKHCAACQFVLFLEHSTSYKAEKDPLYNELKTLIESQEN